MDDYDDNIFDEDDALDYIMYEEVEKEVNDPQNTIAIVIERKSRIIMADGKKILEKLHKIRNKQPFVSVVLKTTAPVCSKTKNFLQGERVQLILD